MKTALRIKRVYEAPAKEDGTRVLVDRIWPRGLSKQQAAIDEWMKEIAPSSALRSWFGHDPQRWPQFHERYFKELGSSAEAVSRLAALMSDRPVTLLFAARDTERNNAVALAEYIALHKQQHG
ncbi:MAG: DUF488 domain-containing protein [Stellaceae bacterium]